MEILIGGKIARLTILKQYQKLINNRNRMFLQCECECGNIIEVRKDCVGVGKRRTNSCGCQKKESVAIHVVKNHTHKQSNTRLYSTWQGMKARCSNENSGCYDRYGGRGIEMCPEWYNNFQTFYDWAISNGYSEELTIDRIDNNGDYKPSNCRWANSQTQCRNRRTNVIVNHEGKDVTLIELSEIIGLKYGTIHSRYDRGDRGNDLIRPLNTPSSTREYRGKLMDCERL